MASSSSTNKERAVGGDSGGGGNEGVIDEIAHGLEDTNINIPHESLPTSSASAGTAVVAEAEGSSSNAAVAAAAIPLQVQAFLPKTISRSYDVYDVPTDCWVQIFDDRIVVGVSQLDQKIGTWILCTAIQSPTDLRSIDYTISTLLGDSTNDLMGVYARQVTEQLIGSLSSGRSSLQVLLGISLARQDNKTKTKKQQEEESQKMFRILVPLLVDLVKDTAAM